MRVLRRLPPLANALRDGRICLSTVTLLGPLLTEENCADLVARAAFLRKRDVEHLVASLAPRAAPKEGLRLVSAASPRATQPLSTLPAPPPAEAPPVAAVLAEPAPPPRPPTPPTVQPVSADAYSLRVTVDGAFKKELDELKALLAHKLPNGDLAAVLREAVHCALEKHGKRKGAVEPSRKRNGPPPRPSSSLRSAHGERSSSPTGSTREPIPVAVRREVWQRDGAKCVWRGEDGRECGSTWKLEPDHVVPAALGGPSTVENLRLHCRSHNVLRAEHVYGRAHMDLFRREQPRTSEGAIPGGGDGADDARDADALAAAPDSSPITG
ncbi:MAG: HNH endonuclease [Myxococcales bacterium]